MTGELQARVAILAQRSEARRLANRERWPDFAQFCDDFTAVFGKPAGITLPDGTHYGKPLPAGTWVHLSVPPKPLPKKGGRK